MSQRLVLDEIIDPFGAKVVVTRDEKGTVTSARFDLTGLPRVDALVAGRAVLEVPSLVERLCGICPAAHHLAGVRAIEALAGSPELPPVARAVRALLHHGSAVVAHASRLINEDRPAAIELRRFGKSAMAAAGSPGHFPQTAMPGGVRKSVAAADLMALGEALPGALEVALRAADRALTSPAAPDQFRGAEVALVDLVDRPDLLGERLLVARGGRFGQSLAPSDWDELIAEEVPAAPAPRPYLRAAGPTGGRYRVGPVAQLRVGRIATPVAAELQVRWLQHGGAAAARAVMTVVSIEAIAELLAGGELTDGPSAVPVAAGDGVGVGWVDGPRGLLVHRYQAVAGRVVAATILTPTMQNEPWLADLLLDAIRSGSAPLELEDAVREADPCLPCSSAPAGSMGLLLEDEPAGGE